MKSRHEAALDTPKAPESRMRWRASSGGPQENVLLNDVLDATYFVLGMQRVDSVRPFKALTIILSGDAAAAPGPNGSAGCRLCRHHAGLRFICGGPS